VTAAEARDYFRQVYGGDPDIIGSAPGRVNIIGEHTDYNGGQVLPIAIDRRTFVALRARPDSSRSKIVSQRESTVGEFDVRHVGTASGQWWDYMTGVCVAMEGSGARLPQFEATVQSDVPMGSGLSSSAALEVATAVALGGVVSEPLDLRKLALLSWHVETQFVGVASGVMDQFASALCLRGQALHLWCDTLETEQVTMPDAVLIFDTASPRELRGSQFNQRRAECEEALAVLRRAHPSLLHLAAASLEQVRLADLSPRIRKRAVHVVEENARVEALVRAADLSRLEDKIFQHFTTLGVKTFDVVRSALARESRMVRFDGRDIRVKVATLPDGSKRAKPEFDDLRRIAEETSRPLAEIRSEV